MGDYVFSSLHGQAHDERGVACEQPVEIKSNDLGGGDGRGLLVETSMDVNAGVNHVADMAETLNFLKFVPL